MTMDISAAPESCEARSSRLTTGDTRWSDPRTRRWEALRPSWFRRAPPRWSPRSVPTAHLHPNTGQQPAIATNGLLTTMTADDAGAIMNAVAGPNRSLIQLRSVGGAVNDVPPEATAYPHRHQHTLVTASVFAPQPPAVLDAAWHDLAGRVDGAYVGFESRPSPATFAHSYPGETGARVTAIWRRYDPDGIFRRPNVTPQS
jgi:hypothetical protein